VVDGAVVLGAVGGMVVTVPAAAFAAPVVVVGRAVAGGAVASAAAAGEVVVVLDGTEVTTRVEGELGRPAIMAPAIRPTSTTDR
jgi:hypothetical protein